MNDVVLKFCVESPGVPIQFEVNTGIGEDEWANMAEAEREEIAQEHYNDHVLWGYEAV